MVATGPPADPSAPTAGFARSELSQPTMSAADPSARHLVVRRPRRVAQTRRRFLNWPDLLRKMAAEKFGRGGAELDFVTRSGVRMTCPNVPGARLPMYEQFADDCYRRAVGARRGRPPGETARIDGAIQVLDIGAHVGAFATALSPRRTRGSRVECYEPSPESAGYLRRNVGRNGLAERVRVHEAAVAATAGTALLDDNSGGSVHNGLVSDDRPAGRTARTVLARRHTVEVATTTFDAAVAAAPYPPEVVKMDCEGGEYALVYASAPASWATVRRIVLEYHPVQGESWDKLRAWFENVGLIVYAHESDVPGLGTAWLTRRSGSTVEGRTS